MKMKWFVTFLFGATLYAGDLANIALKEQTGKPFRLADLRGSYILVDFIYSRCPMDDMCPLTLRLTRRLLDEWERIERPGKPSLRAVALTIDPAFDTPAVLTQLAKRYGLDPRTCRLVTGSDQAVAEFSQNFNVLSVPGNGTISHNVKSVLLDPQLKEIKQYRENEWQPKQVIDDILKNARIKP